MISPLESLLCMKSTETWELAGAFSSPSSQDSSLPPLSLLDILYITEMTVGSPISLFFSTRRHQKIVPQVQVLLSTTLSSCCAIKWMEEWALVAVCACMGSEAHGTGTSPGNHQLQETWKSAGGQRVNERRRRKRKRGERWGERCPLSYPDHWSCCPQSCQVHWYRQLFQYHSLHQYQQRLLMVFPSLAVGDGKCCADPMDGQLWGHDISAEESDGWTWLAQVRQASPAASCCGGHTGAAPQQEVLPAETPAQGLGSSTEGFNC